MINKKDLPNREDYTIKIDIQKNMSNEKVNELYSVLRKHSVYFFIINEFIRKSKKKLNVFITTLIFLTFFSYITLQNIVLYDFVYVIMAFPYLVLLITIFLTLNEIKTYKSKLKNKKIRLIFSNFPYWDEFRKLKEFIRFESNNVYSNLGLLFKENYNGLVIYPNFAFEYATMNPNIYVGVDFSNLITKVDGIVSQYESSKYKYKRYEYKKWLHERKDGGPDRRYSNNKTINYYSYKMLCLKDHCIEVKDHSIYNQLKSEHITKYRYQSEDQTFENIKEKSNKEKLKLDNLTNIEKYLSQKGCLYNNFGEIIELKYKNNTYFINKDGKIDNTDLSIESILGDNV